MNAALVISLTKAIEHFSGLVQDCSNSIDFELELLHFWTKPLI